MYHFHSYVECVNSVLSINPDRLQIMDDTFWQPILKLASDTIVDVRIGVARLVSTASGMWAFHLENL